MPSPTRVTTRAALLAATAVLGVTTAVVLLGVQRGRGLSFDVPELVAASLALLASAGAFLGLRGMRSELREHERVAEVLRESERKFAGILEIAVDAIVTVDESQKILHFNHGAEQIFRWKASDAIGHSLSELLPGRYRTLHARHIGDFADSPDVARRMGSRQLISGLRRTGEEFAAEASISKLETESGRLFTVVLRDVSERKLEEDDDRFLSHATAMMGRSLDYEATLRSVLHLPIPYLADCCVMNIVQEGGDVRRIASVHDDPDHTKRLRQLESRADEAPAWPFHAAQVIVTGRSYYADTLEPDWYREGSPGGALEEAVAALGIRAFTTIPLRARDRSIGTITLISTTPERPRGAREHELGEDLAAQMSFAVDNAGLYESAQRAGRALDELLGVVSHDLRNPLSAVSMCARVLLDEPPEAEQSRRELANAILQSADVMNRLIQDLLDVSVIESGHLRISKSRSALAPLVHRVLDMHRSSAQENGVTMDVAPLDAIPKLDVDTTRIMQVLANLIGNAIKFTERGGRVTIAAKPNGTRVQISVADTGIGIPLEDQPHIFDRYWHARRSSRTLGTGLGLAIARGIVDAHGGHLDVNSVPGKGSTFTFTVPIAAPDEVVAP